MKFRNCSVTPVPFLLCFLAGCATVEPIKSQPDPRIDEVLAGVNQCLANQVQAEAQLQNQAQQLQLQLQQMQAMTEQLKEPRVPGEERPMPPAPVDCPKPPKASGAQVIGYIEQVWISDLRTALPALIDTTTETNTLDVQHLEEFERDGKRWVRFTVLDAGSGEPLSLEHQLKRYTNPAGGTEAANRRPVIRMGIVIGRINQTADFVLYKRKHKTYQLKLGRNALQDLMVVDVSKKNIAPYLPPDKPAASPAAAPAVKKAGKAAAK